MSTTLLRTVFLAALCSGAAAADRPNVVLIMADDLGWKDLGCQGSAYYETPNIDALATAGMRFTQAYAACAVCSPTRAAVLTGRYPARIGVTDWIRPRGSRDAAEFAVSQAGGFVDNGRRPLRTPANRFALPLEEVTLAERFRQAGYATCHVGKWHLGDPGHWPTDQGFDVNVGGCDFGQPPSYFDPYARNKAQPGIPTLPPRKAGEYLTDREADETTRFLRENKGRPFFLSYWPYAVHTPLQAKPDLVARFRERPTTEQSNPTYAAMVRSLDDAVGAIVAELDAAGLADSTLVIFTSDNGGLLGPTNNAPLRSGKGYPYEGGLRVPLIFRWPSHVPAGATSAEPACSIDLVPTLCDAAGLPKPTEELDGVSLWKLITSGGAASLGRDELLWHFPHYRGRDVTPYSVLRSGNRKLIKRYEGPSLELFDLSADPNEQHDLSAEQPDVAAALDRRLTERLTAVGAKIPERKGKG